MRGAKRPDIVQPAWDPNATEDAQEAWLAGAAGGVRRDGVVVVPNAIPDSRISPLRQVLSARRIGSDDADGRSFQPAPLRPRILVPLDGPFADPAVFAPPPALALARRLLGPETIIGEIGAIVLRPGDGPQEARRTAVPLFGGLAVEGDVPPAALTMLAPLTDTGPGAGFPEYWPGSHRTRGGAPDAAPLQPALKAGSVVMSDWRTLYRAGANTSGATQLALYVSFQRKWLVSLAGSDYKPGLRVPRSSLKRLPEAYRPLVSWALHENKTDDVTEFVHLWMGRATKRLRALRGG
ncbi:MAG: hypothetical protein ACREE0_05280 [Phenylobacterium sp.]